MFVSLLPEYVDLVAPARLERRIKRTGPCIGTQRIARPACIAMCMPLLLVRTPVIRRQHLQLVQSFERRIVIPQVALANRTHVQRLYAIRITIEERLEVPKRLIELLLDDLRLD